MNGKAGQIAETAASRMNRNSNDEVSFLRESIEKLNDRLSNIESQISPKVHPSSFILHPSGNHPSQEKFNLAEAVVEELVEFFEPEKTCLFEPNKPCDKCSMCSSRGF